MASPHISKNIEDGQAITNLLTQPLYSTIGFLESLDLEEQSFLLKAKATLEKAQNQKQYGFCKQNQKIEQAQNLNQSVKGKINLCVQATEELLKHIETLKESLSYHKGYEIQDIETPSLSNPPSIERVLDLIAEEVRGYKDLLLKK